MIYSSQEIGYDRPLSFFGPNVLDWNSNPSYTAEYKNVMSIYTSSDAMRKGAIKTYNTTDVVSILRSSQNEEVLIMVNTKNETKEVKTPIEFANGNVVNLLDKKTEILPSVIKLEPYEYGIWRVK